MIKGSIQELDITILNMHRFEKYTTQKLVGLKGENHNWQSEAWIPATEQEIGLLGNQQGSMMFQEYIQLRICQL